MVYAYPGFQAGGSLPCCHAELDIGSDYFLIDDDGTGIPGKMLYFDHA